jgi:squalene-associated FAD-dependent desaturase
MTGPLRVAVIGGGWAGLAAAVEATGLGHRVSLFEMAPMLGGRARRLPIQGDGFALDNGQHILIGAYSETLRLMRTVGIAEADVLRRAPLSLTDAHGRGLQLPAGAAVPAFLRGVCAAKGWPVRDRLALLAAALGWRVRGFRCDASLSVSQLTATLPTSLRRGLVEPLCVAALNTPADQASAQTFLRVLRDALFGGPGASDLLLPRVDLSALFPDAAAAWLAEHGAQVHTGQRVERLTRDGTAWSLDGSQHDRVVLACTSTEAARLAEPHAPAWAEAARALRHEPIVTVLLQSPGSRLPRPMVTLDSDDAAPAQFAFDLGQLRDAAREPGAAGHLALVVSGAARAIEAGLEATGRAVQQQAIAQLGHCMPQAPTVLRVLSEKRATFLCTPGLQRPPQAVAPGLLAAGDYVEGPYPATLEGAVRSGVNAAQAASTQAP